MTNAIDERLNKIDLKFAKLEGKKIDTGSDTLPHDESTSGPASIASQPQFGMPLNFVDGQ